MIDFTCLIAESLQDGKPFALSLLGVFAKEEQAVEALNAVKLLNGEFNLTVLGCSMLRGTGVARGRLMADSDDPLLRSALILAWRKWLLAITQRFPLGLTERGKEVLKVLK